MPTDSRGTSQPAVIAPTRPGISPSQQIKVEVRARAMELALAISPGTPVEGLITQAAKIEKYLVSGTPDANPSG